MVREVNWLVKDYPKVSFRMALRVGVGTEGEKDFAA
jgi:hypothetical protein